MENSNIEKSNSSCSYLLGTTEITTEMTTDGKTFTFIVLFSLPVNYYTNNVCSVVESTALGILDRLNAISQNSCLFSIQIISTSIPHGFQLLVSKITCSMQNKMFSYLF